jgi:hypothetical protein
VEVSCKRSEDNMKIDLSKTLEVGGFQNKFQLKTDPSVDMLEYYTSESIR